MLLVMLRNKGQAVGGGCTNIGGVVTSEREPESGRTSWIEYHQRFYSVEVLTLTCDLWVLSKILKAKLMASVIPSSTSLDVLGSNFPA